MASITVVVAETKPTIDIPKSPCGDIDEARSGANTERGDSAPPTPRKLSPIMPKRVKEEEDDDPLTYLTQLFGFTTLDDSDDSGSEDDESAPPSPRPKGFDKYFFYTTYSGIHYYDCFRNVYRENGTLVHDGSFNFPLNDLFSPSFSIDGVPYCFDLEGLLSNDVHGTPYRVLTWQNEPDVFDLAGFVDSASSQADATVYQHNVNSASYYDGNPMMAPAAAANEYPGAPKTKSEIFSPNVDQNSLQQTLQGGRKLTWSPTSSVEKSPIVPSGSGSRASSADPPLFPESRSSTVIPAAAKWHYVVQQAKNDPEQKLFIESQPDVSESIPLVTKWKEDVVRANKEAAQARPSTKPLKEDRRRCHHCSKVFRRPSSLLDHLNVHSGDKPHVCPFPSCNTGFATKSNMKRHFLTHQVGLMEDYHPGVTRQPGAIRQPGGLKLKKATRPPTAPYNSKAHHTLRFRVSAGQES